MKDKKLQNRLFGCLIAIALFIILIVILNTITITMTEVFTDPDYHFSLKYPVNWSVTAHPQDEKLVLAVFFPPSSSKQDKTYENIGITLMDLSRHPELNDINRFTSSTIRQLTNAFGQYVNVVESKRIRVSGIPAYRYSYITTGPTGFSQSKLRYLYVWFVRGGYGYILTYIGQEEKFEAHRPDVNRMIRTWKFEK